MTHAEIDDLPIGTTLYWARFHPGTEVTMTVTLCMVDLVPEKPYKGVFYEDFRFKHSTLQCGEVNWLFQSRQEALEALRRRVDDRIRQLAELKENLR
jgi:hypothetical protein